jgi:hypothetical protein
VLGQAEEEQDGPGASGRLHGLTQEITGIGVVAGGTGPFAQDVSGGEHDAADGSHKVRHRLEGVIDTRGHDVRICP